MSTYASDKRFAAPSAPSGSGDEPNAALPLIIKLSSEDPISLPDYGDVFKDINTIFNVCAREFTSRHKGPNVKKKDGLLVVGQFKAGSLEIFADPYFTGVLSGVAANAVCALFVYVMRRINGRPEGGARVPLEDIGPNLISSEKLSDSVSKAVQNTASSRRSLKEKTRAFGLSITITFKKTAYLVTEAE